MLPITEEVIERIIREDVPSVDLTTWTLGLRDRPGRLRCTSRADVVVCGTEEASRICARLGVAEASGPPSGTRLAAGDVVLEATGDVAALHLAWRACLKVLESCSGIATRTARFVALARGAAPDIKVLTTPRCFPGTHDLAEKAVTVAGALPHRLGPSEAMVVHEQHWAFCGGLEGLLPRIPQMRRRAPQKKLIVGVTSLAQAHEVAAAGADGVQFDGVPAPTLRDWVVYLRAAQPHLVLLAAGGVTEENAAAYAATGVHGLVTSSVCFGPPADLATQIIPL